MKEWQKRCLCLILTVVMLFCTIPVSGATGSWITDGAEIETITVDDKIELTTASSSNAGLKEPEAKDEKTPVTKVTITSKPQNPVKVGTEKLKLRFEVVPNTKEVISKWTSSDPDVVNVDANGNLVPLKAGTATIELEVTGKGEFEGTVSDTYELTVLPADEAATPLTGVDITSIPKEPVKVGAGFKLRRNVFPAEADKSVSTVWSSTNPEVVTIDEFGNVKAVGAGTATIKLEVTGKGVYKGTVSDSYELTVLPAAGPAIPLTGVTITSRPTVPQYVGDASFKLRYAAAPYGAAATAKWSSTNPDIASIDQYGNVTLAGAGKTTINLEATGKDGYEGIVYDSFLLTVLPVTLSLDRNEVFLDRGESADITVNFGPESARLMKVLPVIYQVGTGEEEAVWPCEYLSTSLVKDGKFPDNKLTIKIEEDMPENTAYGKAKMKVLLLKKDAAVEEDEMPELEDILAEEEITIYFREKKAPVLPTVKPGVPRVDRLIDALNQIDFNNLTLLEKKELANEVLESLEKQKITVRHTVGNETLAKNLMAVEEKLEELLGITPEKSGASENLNAISFTGSLFNVLSGRTPVLLVEDEMADDNKTSGMGIIAGCTPIAMDIELTTEDGNRVSKLNVPIQLRIDASALGLDIHRKIVIKHIKSDGTVTFLPYGTKDSQLVFWVSDFSTFVFANGSTDAEGGTSTGGGGGGKGGGGSSARPVSASGPATEGTWTQDAGGWRFAYMNGNPLADRWVELIWNGKADWYHFNAQAYADSGWLQDGDYTYYLNPVHNGQFAAMMTGWQQIDNKWYYFQTQTGGPKGAMLKNTTTPDGFRVGSDGVRQ